MKPRPERYLLTFISARERAVAVGGWETRPNITKLSTRTIKQQKGLITPKMRMNIGY
jgi:hypothetical protein